MSLLESGEQRCIKAIIITFTSSLTGGSFLQRIVGDKSKRQSALVEKERKKPSSADDLTSAVDWSLKVLDPPPTPSLPGTDVHTFTFKQICPFCTSAITWRRQAREEEALNNLPGSTKQSSLKGWERAIAIINQTNPGTVSRQRWENLRETGQSAYELCWAHRFHLELNWPVPFSHTFISRPCDLHVQLSPESLMSHQHVFSEINLRVQTDPGVEGEGWARPLPQSRQWDALRESWSDYTKDTAAQWRPFFRAKPKDPQCDSLETII